MSTDDFCYACLTNSRTLVDVSMLPFSIQEFCKDLQMNEMSQLCWECKAELYRIERFKRKVKHANDILKDISNLQSSSSNCMSLSNLTVSSHSGFDLIVIGPKLESAIQTKTKIRLNVSNPLLLSDNHKDTANSGSKLNREEKEIVNRGEREGYNDSIIVKVEPEYFYKDLNSTDSVEVNSNEDISLNLKTEPVQKSLQNDHEMSEDDNIINSVVVGKINMRLITEEEMTKLREKIRKSAKFNEKPYRCTKCVIQFTNVNAFNEHNTLHSHENRPFECRICEQRFLTQYQLTEHVKSHYQIYVCTRCNYESFRLRRLQDHVRKVHQENECKKCNLTFNSVEQFKEHNRQHDYINCRYCKKTVKTSYLKVHIKEMHEAVDIKCEFCLKVFKGQQRLKLHIKNKHEKREVVESLYCVECDKHFKTKLSYIEHVKRTMKHSTEKFECDACHVQVGTKSLLISHIQSLHTENKTFQCPVCDRKFGGKSVLRNHMYKNHTEKKRNHVCQYCGKGFMSGQTLKQHVNSHLGKRPYKCDMCDSTFSYSGTLYTHKKLVHYKNKN